LDSTSWSKGNGIPMPFPAARCSGVTVLAYATATHFVKTWLVRRGWID
jgi:hypothetical protein